MTENAQYSPGLLDSAREMIASLDVAIIPIKAKTKQPIFKDWPNRATKDPEQVARWLTEYPGCNLGAIPGDRYVIVDIDPRNGGLMSARRISKDLPITRTHQTGGGVDLDTPGSHLWYLIPESVTLPKQGGKVADGIDFKTGHGSQVLIPESITDRPYRLTRATAPVEIPAGLLARITGQTAGRSGRSVGERPRDSFGEPIPKGERDASLVAFAGDLARLVANEQITDQMAIVLLKERHSEAESDPHDDIPWDKVEERYWHFRNNDIRKDEDPNVKAEEPVLADGYLATPIGNMERWLEHAQGRAKWVDAWGKWIVYRDGRWVEDPYSVLVTEIAQEVVQTMRDTAAPLPKEDRDPLRQWAARSSSKLALNSMSDLARGKATVYQDYNDLNQQPHLFNVQNGTLDLTNGELLPHKPTNLITAQAPITHDPLAGCTLWLQCLDRWVPDEDVRWFLQKAVGSGLLGYAVQHLFVNHGAGGNGKGVFFGVIERILGDDYYATPHNSLLTVQKHKEHDTVKASLYNRRIAVAGETAEHDQLDEASIKALTGGDVIRGRRMREDEWSFHPTHTMFIHTNYKPRIRGTDQGIWRRIFVIPWDVEIPLSEQDDTLTDKLMEEAPGILNWLIDGAVAWQQERLTNIPDGIRRPTDEYRLDSDLIGRWMLENGIYADPMGGDIARSLLQSSFELWCQEQGIKMAPWKSAKERLLSLGVTEARRRSHGGGQTWYFCGVGGLSQDDTPTLR